MTNHDNLLPFFTNLLNLAKEIYSKATKDKPEMMRIWASILSILKDSLTTPELQSLTDLKQEVESFIKSCEDACLASTELKKLFVKLVEFKHSLKEDVCDEAKDIYEKIHNFFKCCQQGEV